MSRKLPFPLWAVFVGFFGVLLIVPGVLGLVGSAPIPVLADPAVAWALVGIGGLLIVVETLVIALSIVNRR
ncbi:MAG: hypothetical protein AAGE01_04315 [Pseudomonadota bacterium]